MQLDLPARILTLRKAAKSEKDPPCADETLALLMGLAGAGTRVLEVGAGLGLTAASLAMRGASVVAIERDGARCMRARELFSELSLPVTLLEGDAGSILPTLEGPFDVIFLDCAKVQYRRYFADCKRLLARGGTLVSDDVLLFGRGGEVPAKRHMLARHIGEFLELLTGDPDFSTEIYEYGEGVAVSKRV